MGLTGGHHLTVSSSRCDGVGFDRFPHITAYVHGPTVRMGAKLVGWQFRVHAKTRGAKGG